MASNNGVERDGETQRFTVHCTEKDCKKRQCKAIKMSFKDSESMSDALLKRIMLLMRVSNAASWVKDRPRSHAGFLAGVEL